MTGIRSLLALVQSNTIAGVSDIAQIPDGQWPKLITIETPSQSVQSWFMLNRKPIWVSVASLRNLSGENTDEPQDS